MSHPELFRSVQRNALTSTLISCPVAIIRSPVQIKSHGQKLMKRAEQGEDIFAEFGHLQHLESISDDESFNEPSSRQSDGGTFTRYDHPGSKISLDFYHSTGFNPGLVTPKLSGTTMRKIVSAVKAPVKRPIPRLALAKSVVLPMTSISTTISMTLRSDSSKSSSSPNDLDAAISLMSLASVAHSHLLSSNRPQFPIFLAGASSAFEKFRNRRIIRVMTGGTLELACLELRIQSPRKGIAMVTPPMPWK